MLEDREWEGFWWRPENPDRKVAGSLRFSQREIRLRLLGAFEDLRPGPLGHGHDEPRILGVTNDGKAITLERCLDLGQKLSFPGFPTSIYGPHEVLVGAHYEADEEVRFDEVSIRLSDIDTWAALSGFSYQLHWDDQGKSMSKLDLSYTPPERIAVELDEETTLSIKFAWKWSGLSAVTTEMSVGQAASFGISFTNQGTKPRCLEYVFQLRNFLSLAVGRPIQVRAVTGYHNPPADELDEHPLSVEVLYLLTGIQDDEPSRSLHPSEVLFTLGDAMPRLPEILRAWFERQEVFGPVFNRYFYLVHNRHMAREIQFESYVWTLETFHRRSTRATGVPDEEHQARLSAILTAVPDEHRDWLEGKLTYSNEFSLAERLKETLSRCPVVTARVAGGSRNQRK